MWIKAAVIGFCLLIIRTQAIVSDEVFDNCMFLGDRSAEVSWTVRREESAIDFQLCGCGIDADGPNEYIAFGLSADNTRTLMIGADATIAWVDNEIGAQAVDYHLSSYIQCRGGTGACPDTVRANTNDEGLVYSLNCTNDVYNISGFRRDGLQCVSFTRTYSTSDTECDIAFDVDANQYIVWAVGGLGETAFKHFRRGEATDPAIQFGRVPSLDCRGGLLCPNCDPFVGTVMDATGRNETFVANIGPPANPRGYMSIANRAGWGIAWYINDTLIPNIMVERGYTYTFKSMGGQDDTNPGTYHPFYLTDSVKGGYLKNDAASRSNEVVYAGFNDETPLGVGPYCEFREPVTASNILNTCGPEQDYYQNLERTCQLSDADTIKGFTWVPDGTTPDIVYYQCATHLNLGYKITVVGHAPKLVACSLTVLLMLIVSFLQ